MQEDVTLMNWLQDLAAKKPTPGGGAVAALAAALAAALIGMVSIYTTGKKWHDRETRMQVIYTEAAQFRIAAIALMEADAVAFAEVGTAYALPHDSAAEKSTRANAIQIALSNAAEPPSASAKLADKLLTLDEELAVSGNPNVLSDVAVAASAIRAALESAIVNIEINEKLIIDSKTKHKLQACVEEASKNITRADAVVSIVRQRIKT